MASETPTASDEAADAALLARLTGPAGAEPTLERSQHIILAAYDLLDEAGLEGLTIRAVLKKTGLSRRAFYERFSGKDDMVLAVFEHTLRLAASYYRREIAAIPDPMDRLRLILTSVVMGRASLSASDEVAEDRRGAALSREHLRLADSHPQELQASLKPLISVIADQLSDAMKAGLVRDYPPYRLATLVYNVVSTTVHTELITQEGARPDRARRAQLAEEIWEFCRRAIAA